MAAEYQLYIKEEIEGREVTNLFSKLNWRYTEERIGNRGFIYSFSDVIGFLLSVVANLSKVEMNDRMLVFRTVITFRYINEVTFVTSKTNMLRFVLELMKIYHGDFVLLFNGELVIMKKDQEGGLVLSNADFWNPELLENMDRIKFTRSNFELL